MKNPVVKTKHSIQSLDAASLPKPKVKPIKGGKGSRQKQPPEDESGGWIGSDDMMDG